MKEKLSDGKEFEAIEAEGARSAIESRIGTLLWDIRTAAEKAPSENFRDFAVKIAIIEDRLPELMRLFKRRNQLKTKGGA